MKKKFLFVARDIMSARIQIPVIRLLKKAGHEIVIAAEGKAFSIFDEAGLEICLRSGEKVTFLEYGDQFNLFQPSTPDLVLVGCSVPINWEIRVAWEAFRQKIPVVAFADTWGAFSRLKMKYDGFPMSGDQIAEYLWSKAEKQFVPDLALVIDEHEAVQIVRGGLAKKATVIGDYSSQMSPGPVNPAGQTILDQRSRQGKILVVAIAELMDSAEEFTEMVVKCLKLEKSDPSHFVIHDNLRHPKLNAPKDLAIHAKCVKMFERAGLEVIKVGGPESAAKSYKGTSFIVGGASTALRWSVRAGYRNFHIKTPGIVRGMQKESGIPFFPLAEMGIIPTIKSPRAFCSIDYPPYEEKGKAWIAGSKFNPDMAVKAILELSGA